MPSGKEERCPGCGKRVRDWPLGLSACPTYLHVAIIKADKADNVDNADNADKTPRRRLYWLKLRSSVRVHIVVSAGTNSAKIKTVYGMWVEPTPYVLYKS